MRGALQSDDPNRSRETAHYGKCEGCAALLVQCHAEVALLKRSEHREPGLRLLLHLRASRSVSVWSATISLRLEAFGLHIPQHAQQQFPALGHFELAVHVLAAPEPRVP